MIQEPELAARRWLILFAATFSFFSVGVTFFVVPPLVPELVARFGLSHLEVGVLMGAIAVPAVFLSIPLGAALDRWPARAAGTAGLALMATGGCLFAVAPGYWSLLAGRFLFGIGGLVINLLFARLITKAFQGRELSLAMGIFNAVYPASMIVIFTFHGRLLEVLGWRGELGVLAVLAVLAVPLHLVAVPAAPSRSEPRTDGAGFMTRPAPSLIVLAGSWMFFFAAYASVFTFAPEWAGGGSRGLLVVTAITWVALLANPLLGHVIDRVGLPAVWAGGGLLLLAAVLVLMSFDRLGPLPAMLLVGVAAASVPTAVYSLPVRLVPASQVGFAFGFITAFSNLGTIAGPAATGALRDASASWTTPWLVLSGVALLGALSLLPLARRRSTRGSSPVNPPS